MNAKAFVDTNILIYAHDESDAGKHRRAAELITSLWTERRGVLSTQVIQEFAVNLQRRMSVTLKMPEVRRRIEYFLDWEIVINVPSSTLGALEVQERYQLSFWDAMIVQAAESAGCEVLYSEDLSHGQKYGGVLVVNPFLG
jgi:predicted nucleic acid-binding protein